MEHDTVKTPEATTTLAVAAPRIYQIEITRFRGIEHLCWRPSTGVNIVLGSGDIGKTTLLDAIGLILSPAHTNLSYTDFFGCDEKKEFAIEAILSIPPEFGINKQSKVFWPWKWDGKDVTVP